MAVSVDISEYLNKISSDEDKKLFEEAVLAAKVGALRASYIMIWISCAESIKRRFNEAKIRDGQAKRIASEIGRKEAEHKAVDKYLLDEALNYGFIDATEFTHLFKIYQNRCIFGHPYEIQPLVEQLQATAAEAVTFILSKPIKLRHGYMEAIISKFIKVPNYIDDTEETISLFADEVINKFDTNLYGWFINRFAKELKQIENDASLDSIRFRAYHFIKAFLMEIDLSFMTVNEWHDFVMNYEKLSLNIFICTELFCKIGKDSSNYLVGALLSYSEKEPRVLSLINSPFNNRLLTDRHIQRIKNHLDSLNLSFTRKANFLRDSGIDIGIVFDNVIELLKSHDWYVQNPTIEYIMNRSIEELKKLSNSDLEILGRNILQSADGGSETAQNWLRILGKAPKDYPNAFFKGMLLECFIREDQNIRLKIKKLESLHKVFDTMQSEKRVNVINEVVDYVKEGKIDGWYNYMFSAISENKAHEFPLFSDVIVVFNSFESLVSE